MLLIQVKSNFCVIFLFRGKKKMTRQQQLMITVCFATTMIATTLLMSRLSLSQKENLIVEIHRLPQRKHDNWIPVSKINKFSQLVFIHVLYNGCYKYSHRLLSIIYIYRAFLFSNKAKKKITIYNVFN